MGESFLGYAQSRNFGADFLTENQPQSYELGKS